MDLEGASISRNAHALSKWAAQAVEDTDRLLAIAEVRPLSPQEQRENLTMQRELLVRLSQQNTLLEWANDSRGARVLGFLDALRKVFFRKP